MRITTNLEISKSKQGDAWFSINGIWKKAEPEERKNLCSAIRSYAKKKNKDEHIISIIKENVQKLFDSLTDEERKYFKLTSDEFKQKDICNKLIEFFKDVEFEPNFRFVNTLALHSKCIQSARNYIISYFELSNNQFINEIKEKTKSCEFNNLVNDMADLVITNHINKRLKLYYGSQGTGKTTRGLKDSHNNTITCHSAMLPTDLLEDFAFVDGKATFKKSALWNAMEEGKPIMLDEINLLPFESLRFLQGILDNKDSIVYKGNTINIKEGFEIIGTMNLIVNGSVFNLPDPLVDRAYELVKFNLTAESLMGALQ